MILAGDIGGTKTNLALCEIKEGILNIQTQAQYPSGDFTSLEEVIKAFESNTSLDSVTSACFGIAGPVINGRCRTTNLPWEINTKDLQTQLHVESVKLLNDLEATAYGMLYLPEDAFVQLNTKAKKSNGNRAVIAAGTGLGEAILYHDNAQYHPMGSEGGHCDFAPQTPQQDALLLWLRKRYPQHVSIERILSGPGIFTLYEFLHESGFAPEPAAMLNLPRSQDKSAMISKCALTENDPLCLETLRLFAKIYGAEAGNLALKSMSLGGVYIGGGIAPKILSILQESHFIDAFVAKGRFKTMLEGMHVKIALNQETALIGAAHFAHDRL